ncbi:unnamed protein product [Bursaphelenchus okinawaensis]|uniref:Bicarbonate transporter-like transmembrane domain-containing protein n=1 Tax=Bursaphelenchus okinawaensis TaxID=465554 RepID=A0A811LM65_9BILA|nr:unnamed protein product [Bursaphelenchus okinawaensis]CAG9124221.1 unnamed protein product [Bursaphelenchus okinawaensis]
MLEYGSVDGVKLDLQMVPNHAMSPYFACTRESRQHKPCQPDFIQPQQRDKQPQRARTPATALALAFCDDLFREGERVSPQVIADSSPSTNWGRMPIIGRILDSPQGRTTSYRTLQTCVRKCSQRTLFMEENRWRDLVSPHPHFHTPTYLRRYIKTLNRIKENTVIFRSEGSYEERLRINDEVLLGAPYSSWSVLRERLMDARGWKMGPSHQITEVNDGTPLDLWNLITGLQPYYRLQGSSLRAVMIIQAPPEEHPLIRERLQPQLEAAHELIQMRLVDVNLTPEIFSDWFGRALSEQRAKDREPEEMEEAPAQGSGPGRRDGQDPGNQDPPAGSVFATTIAIHELDTSTPLFESATRKLPWYLSDFTDFFSGRLSQSFAATVCVFFANLTNIITFGAVMERTFNGEMAAVENILCGALTGVVFGLFSGQPLNVLSATGPTLIFEKIIYDMCKTQGWEFLPFRFWMGCWIALILVIIVAKDLSALVAFITRFTEEAFATLISVVFIIQAIEKILEIRTEAPLTPNPGEFISSTCQCITNSSRSTLLTDKLYEETEKCLNSGGKLFGKACFFKPDVFLTSILLALGTYAVAMKLHKFKQSPYLNTVIRNIVADFGLLISIVLFSALSYFIGISVPILQVPSSFTPTMKRSWIVDIMNVSSTYVIFLSAVPAILYTILIIMDQQITAVIVNRKDNLLKKGGGYHLDLFILAPLIVICALLGLPFYVAATVLSLAHLDALKQQSVSSAPGEPPRFLGIKEQRLSTIFAHILIGFSLFLTPVLRLVPLPVLTGIFLYMGVVSLGGQQFVQRFQLLFMSSKTQPEYHWLRAVRMKRTHLFTFIQLICVLALFGLKNLKGLKMTFPLMLLVMVVVRALFLERRFSAKELLALDDRLPSWKEIMKPKTKRFFPESDRSDKSQTPLTAA